MGADFVVKDKLSKAYWDTGEEFARRLKKQCKKIDLDISEKYN